MNELTDTILKNEFAKWLHENGKGRNSDHLRFGQYIWNKYIWRNQDTFRGNNDGFYSESPSNAYLEIKKQLA